jgi:hypothetical protein
VTEAVGNADAVRSTELALRNLERVAGSLLQVAERPGEDYSLLDELYGNTVQQWGRYMGHVAAVVGGADSQERRGTGIRFEPVSRERQVEAVRFLNEHGPSGSPTSWWTRRCCGASSPRARCSGSAPPRPGWWPCSCTRRGWTGWWSTRPWPPGRRTPTPWPTWPATCASGIWGELSASRVAVDVFRRNLQRAHLAAWTA